MCAPVQIQSCNCASSCNCMATLTIEDEIKLLEANKQRMMVQLEMTERRIEALKKKT